MQKHRKNQEPYNSPNCYTDVLSMPYAVDVTTNTNSKLFSTKLLQTSAQSINGSTQLNVASQCTATAVGSPAGTLQLYHTRTVL